MTLRLDPNTDLDRAAELLRAGALVAFPTETVYGLGGIATSDRAVADIYEAKARPFFNPLIAHVADIEMARRIAVLDGAALDLAQAFWPGPMTLVLPVRADAGLSQLMTAGLDTVAVRMPAHPVARALLAKVGAPVAAPSANRSGKISPTTADHVLEELDGRIAAVVDGGPCDVGVESTILSLDPPTLLRPGGLPVEAIEAAIGGSVLRHAGDTINAPGQLASHYAPNAPMRLNAVDLRDGEVLLGFGEVDCALNLSRSGDLVEAASNLFGHMRKLDAMGADRIAVSPIPDHGLGRAINDRLARAAAPRDQA